MDTLGAVLAAIGGGTGLSAVLVTIFSYRKYRAEADATRVANEQTEMEYIKKSFKELNEETKAQFNEFKESAKAEIKGLHEEIDRLRESNATLDSTVRELKDNLSSLMAWVEGDNKRYREWLEAKVHELDPSILFPPTTDPPNMHVDDRHNEDPQQQ